MYTHLRRYIYLVILFTSNLYGAAGLASHSDNNYLASQLVALHRGQQTAATASSSSSPTTDIGNQVTQQGNVQRNFRGQNPHRFMNTVLNYPESQISPRRIVSYQAVAAAQKQQKQKKLKLKEQIAVLEEQVALFEKQICALEQQNQMFYERQTQLIKAFTVANKNFIETQQNVIEALNKIDVIFNSAPILTQAVHKIITERLEAERKVWMQELQKILSQHRRDMGSFSPLCDADIDSFASSLSSTPANSVAQGTISLPART